MSVYLSNTFQSKHGNSCHTYCHAHNRNCFASILFLLYALVATSVASLRAVRCFWHLVKLPSVAVKTFVLGGGHLVVLPLFGQLAIFIACGANIKHFRRSIRNCCTYFDYALLQLVILFTVLLNIAGVLCRLCCWIYLSKGSVALNLLIQLLI